MSDVSSGPPSLSSPEKPRISRFVIKPTLACTADCPFCSNRRSLHKEIRHEKTLSLEQWEKIIGDARSLGAEYLTISGGEPTLYRHLIELVKIGKRNQMGVTLNTNGFTVTEAMVHKLLDAGLGGVLISLHSDNPELHDKVKSQSGLWQKTTNAVRLFARLTKGKKFKIHTHGIICRENYQTYDQVIKLHYDLGSDSMVLVYLEGDFEKRFLLNEEEIKAFREKTLPRAIEFCRKNLDKPFAEAGEKALSVLYDSRINSIENFAKGLYNPDQKYPCDIPNYQALCLANGDVHPCNIVEYTHEPVMGNLFENSLPEIWHGETWNRFRKEPFDYCKLCPMPLHQEMDFRSRLTLKQKMKRYARGIKNVLFPAKAA